MICIAPPQARPGLKVIEYTFAQPAVEGEEAVWRVHLPAVEALVYLNGKYLEHHQPEDKTMILTAGPESICLHL